MQQNSSVIRDVNGNDRYVLHAPYRTSKSPFYYVRIRDVRAHKTFVKSTREKRLGEALQYALDHIRGLLGTEAADGPSPKPFEECYLEWTNDRRLRAITKRNSLSDFRGIYLPYFGELSVNDITKKDVRQFFKLVRKERGSADSTIANHVGRLRAFFNWAIEEGYCTENPTAGIKKGRKGSRSIVILTHDEAARLVEACGGSYVVRCDTPPLERKHAPPEYLKPAVLIALLSGLRKTNTRALKWSQVDLKNRRITIPVDDYKAERQHEAPINSELFGALQELNKRRRSINPNDLVLEWDGHLDSFHAACKRAGLRYMRWHDLQHTHGSWLGSREPEAVVAACLGHSPKSITAFYSGHVSHERKLEAVEKLPRLLGRKKRAGK